MPPEKSSLRWRPYLPRGAEFLFCQQSFRRVDVPCLAKRALMEQMSRPVRVTPSIVEVEVLRRSLLEPEPVLLRHVFEEFGCLLEHVFGGLLRTLGRIG